MYFHITRHFINDNLGTEFTVFNHQKNFILLLHIPRQKLYINLFAFYINQNLIANSEYFLREDDF